MRRLCATVLIMEAIVIGLAIPVAIKLEHASGKDAATAGAVLGIAAVLLAVLAARGPLRLLLAGGSVLQVLVVAAGAWVPAMYFLGAIFAGLWAIGIWLGHRVEQVQAAYARADQAQAAGAPANQAQAAGAPADHAQAGRAPDRPGQGGTEQAP
jgi:hypothetical protein